MPLVGKTSVDNLVKKSTENVKYRPIDKADIWKVDAIKEIVEAKSRRLEIEEFYPDELEDILMYLCTS